jgi:hypothetical protein
MVENLVFKRRKITMKKYSILFVILALALASFACQTLTGGGGGGDVVVPEQPADGDDDGGEELEVEPTLPPVVIEEDGDITVGGESEFPIPAGAINVMNMSGLTNFQVEMTLEEGMNYYRDEFVGKSGYVEREILTVVSDTTFNMAFDGHPSGQAIIVQGVDMGDGTINISVRLEDV